jgi:mRNA interferase MazF
MNNNSNFKAENKKNYSQWTTQKTLLNNDFKRPDFAQAEIWECSFGENIGFEIDGKNQYFSRPVLIIKKLSCNTFIAIPLTTKIKDGSWYYPSKINGKEGRYIFAQIKMVDAKRLNYRICKLSSSQFGTIKSKLKEFL